MLPLSINSVSLLIQVILEIFFEFFAGFVDAGLDGADGDLHDYGYLNVLVAADEEAHGLGGFLGEVVDGFVDFLDAGGGIAAVGVELVVGEWGGEFLDEGGVFLVLGVVEEGIVHDFACPRIEVPSLLVVVGVVEDAEEGLLQEVVGAVPIVREAVGVVA